jgi:hypothetical protein
MCQHVWNLLDRCNAQRTYWWTKSYNCVICYGLVLKATIGICWSSITLLSNTINCSSDFLCSHLYHLSTKPLACLRLPNSIIFQAVCCVVPLPKYLQLFGHWFSQSLVKFNVNMASKCIHFSTVKPSIHCDLFWHLPCYKSSDKTIQLCVGSYTLNVTVEWLSFLLHIKKVPGSNFGLETGYPDWGL